MPDRIIGYNSGMTNLEQVEYGEPVECPGYSTKEQPQFCDGVFGQCAVQGILAAVRDPRKREEIRESLSNICRAKRNGRTTSSTPI